MLFSIIRKDKAPISVTCSGKNKNAQFFIENTISLSVESFRCRNSTFSNGEQFR